MERKISIFAFIGFCLTATYTAIKVYLEALNIYTGIIFLASLFFLMLLLAQAAFSFFSTANEQRTNLRFSLVIFFILIFSLELFLRFSLRTHITYGEKNGGLNYVSVAKENLNSWFWVYSPFLTNKVEKHEFTTYRKTNFLGLAEGEIHQKAENEYRILAIGDSFTEGEGVSYDSTWVKKLEKDLKIEGKQVKTINAGIGGSDPVYAYKLLTDKLPELSIDLAILTLNTSDLMDVNNRGGFERFQADGTTKVVEPPKTEWIYGISYIFRHIYHDLLKFSTNRMQPLQENGYTEALAIIVETIDKFVSFAKQKNFSFLVVIHPIIYDFTAEGYVPFELENLKQILLEKRIPILDIKEYLNSKGYITKENAQPIYWPIDSHFNQKGYNLFLEAVVEKLSNDKNLIKQKNNS